MSAQIKIAHEACSTILLYLEAMQVGKLTFEQAFPNGLSDMAANLIEPIVAKLEAPLD